MKTLLSFCILIPILAMSQVGGGNGFQALDITTNPRSAALAGTNISIADGDISQFFENPATLDSARNGAIFFNINPYFVDLNVYSGAYAFDMNKIGTLSIGINYLSYGSFDATDDSGNIVGDFSANDYAFTIGKAHQVGPVTLGVNLKIAHTSIENYGSTAIVGDIGGIFRASENWTIGMVFSNFGGRISNFNELVEERIPFDVKLGTTFKPEYMPLRFTVTTSNLVDQNVVEESDSEGRSSDQIDRIIRRINFGAELLLSENFQILVGYNHKRKQELKLEDTGGGAGFSYGLMAGIKQFQIRFSRATYHAAGGTSFISIQTNLNEFKRIL